jgi:YHS domain-containing protein
MYIDIKNIDSINKKFKCGKSLANYLIKHGFYILSKNGKDYYFSDTFGLQLFLDSMNWLDKLIYR